MRYPELAGKQVEIKRRDCCFDIATGEVLNRPNGAPFHVQANDTVSITFDGHKMVLFRAPKYGLLRGATFLEDGEPEAWYASDER